MDKSLQEYRGMVERRAAADDFRHVIKYQPLIEPTVGALRAALDRLSKINPQIRVTAKRVTGQYQFSPLDWGPVRKLISELLNIAGGALHTLDNKPGEITRLIAKIEARKPEDFVSVSVAKRVELDLIDARPLIDVDRGLDALPTEVERLEREIQVAVAEAAEREQQGAGHRLPERASSFERNDSDNASVAEDFPDPRL